MPSLPAWYARAVSKAFTKEDEGADAKLPLVVPARAPLPHGVDNYVTQRGLSLLRDEHQRLQSERASADATSPEGARSLLVIDARLAELETRISSAVLVDPAAQPRDEVRFGAQVTVRTEAGELRQYRLVGVDEADGARGLVAFTAPLARALQGKRVGDVALLRTPRGRSSHSGASDGASQSGEEELEVVAIHYDDLAR